MRLRALLEYDGGGFHGWQIQPGRQTIQGRLEEALRTILRQAIRVEASGRTDAGVHARGQVIAFDVAGADVDVRRLARSLNALCGPGIQIRGLLPAPAEFDPRRWAIRRTYEYRIENREWRSPFSARWAWHVHHPLDVDAMRVAARAMIGTHDFRSFQAADCDARSSVRTVERSDVDVREGEITYRVTANAFLRHMVRNIVGTLVEIGRGLRPVEDMATVLGARNRTLAGPTAPPHGLFLLEVDYPKDRIDVP